MLQLLFELFSINDCLGGFLAVSNFKEGRVCLVSLFRPVWMLVFIRMINRKTIIHFSTTVNVLCMGANTALCLWCKSLIRLGGESADDITVNQYLHHSSDSWRPQVQPSVCPPSRSAHPGPQMTPGRSEWTSQRGNSNKSHDRSTKRYY